MEYNIENGRKHGFDVKVIAHSVSEESGLEIATLQLRYPRFIHAEFMTHRVFSRNASSSRAIPVAKMIEQVRNEPAMPIHWGKNQPGMQAAAELAGEELDTVKTAWLAAADLASQSAELMYRAGVHKQVANRILEPFQFISVVVTATDWRNFFELRAHKDAQPEIQLLAVMMKEAMKASVPARLKAGDWHVPYVDVRYFEGQQVFYWNDQAITLEQALKCSAACCARTSYNNHDGTSATLEKNIELHDMLVVSEPKHASPVEHQATPDVMYLNEQSKATWRDQRLHGNLTGFVQYRKLVEQDLPVVNFTTTTN